MLYPIIKSFATHQIKIDDHILYLEEYGNPEGVPILFLHGGPGSGCSDNHKALFNPEKFRVIFPDQRGSWKSKPKGSINNNNINFLIEDIEIIRNKLGIKKWILVGGSWGSTLALVYAQKYPKIVSGIVVRALFLGTEKEIDWAFRKAAQIFKPELYYKLLSLMPNNKIENPIYYLGKRLEDKDPNIFIPAAKAWGAYESSLSTININTIELPDTLNNYIAKKNETYPNTPFMEWHYIKNNFFLEKNQIKNNIKIINDIPGIILQSSYDLLCPPNTSFLLSKMWLNSELRIISKAGHYINDPGVTEEMISSIESISKKYPWKWWVLFLIQTYTIDSA